MPYLELRHVSRSFGSNHVLEDVNFKVMSGQTVCILGRSGVGKSVCLRILMGFLKPDAGRVIAAGEDITDYSEEELRKESEAFDNLRPGEDMVGLEKAFEAAEEDYRPGEGKKK